MNKHLRITKWDNGLIEAICASVILISAILTAIYFGFGQGPIVTLQAVAYAFAVDGMFYLSVRLARHYFAQGWSRAFAGVFWLLVAGAAGAFTWHNNLLFAANAWHLDPSALARAGVSDGLELQLHAIIPVAVVLFGAIIPRPRQEKSAAEITAEAEQKIALMQAKNVLRAAQASEAGAGLRGVVGGFFGQALQLTEKQAQSEARRKERNERRLRNERLQRRGLELGLLSGDEEMIDFDWLEGQINLKELPLPEQLEEVEEPDEMTASGKHKVWMTAAEVAAELGISQAQAERRMQARYQGRFPALKSKDFKVRGRLVRKAHFASVEDAKRTANFPVELQADVQAKRQA